MYTLPYKNVVTEKIKCITRSKCNNLSKCNPNKSNLAKIYTRKQCMDFALYKEIY